jgi:hypothetical protein
MSAIARRFLLLLGSALLFFCALPLSYRHLAHFMYWTSLMSWPGYDPLLYWFPEVYERPHLWTISLILAALVVVGLALFTRHTSFRRAVSAVVCPIWLALAVQYAAITRLDDHVFWFLTKGTVRGLLWQFDSAALLTCVTISIIYSALATAPILVVRFIDRPNQAMQPTAGPSDA